MKKSINRIVTILVNSEVISKDDIEVYSFGLFTMILTLVQFSFLLLVFSLTGETRPYIVFILGFCSLRYFSGGHHSKSAIFCTVLTFLSIKFTVIFSFLLYELNNKIIPSIFAIVALVLVYKYSPSNVKNRPLTESEHSLYKMISRRVVIGEMMIVLICSLYNFYSHELYVFSMAILMQSLNLITIRSDINEDETSISNQIS